MYTQCPECQVTFKVTAEVLQQARGRVRCGNCGEAFNALDHLSESPPVSQPLAPPDPETERKSQELLNTLNQMVGPEDIRIEDTGIEWRVVDDEVVPQEGSPNGEQAPAEDQPPSDAEAASTPEDSPSEEELRYDDNTPLPEEFEGDDDEQSFVHAEATGSFEFTEPSEGDVEDELDLSEPDEWTDLLDEVDVDVDAGEAGEDSSSTPEADAEDTDEDAAETGIDIAAEKITAEDIEPADAHDDESDHAEDDDEFEFIDDEDVDPKQPSDEEIAAEADAEEDVDDWDDGEPETDSGEYAFEEETGTDDDEAEDGDEYDTESDSGEYALEEETGTDDEAENGDEYDTESDSGEYAFEEETGTDDDEAEDGDEYDTESDSGEYPVEDNVDEDDVFETDAEHTGDDEDDLAGESGESSDDDDELEWAADASDEDEQLDSSGEFERAIEIAEEEADDEETDDETRVFDDPVESADDSEGAGSDESGSDEVDEIQNDIAAMTANMQIDPEVIRAMQDGDFDAAMTNEDGNPLVETIIMEGDAVRDALEAADTGERRGISGGDPASLLDTYISTRKPEKTSATPQRVMLIGALVLALALAGQYIHSQRETLATQAWFAAAVAPIYESMGMPVTPYWDIKGWQFEATSGSTGGSGGDLLTISSRVSNRSGQPLPYPLVHVSLTDRYQEVIGSRILDPADYLTDGVSGDGMVGAGGSFTATITITDTSADATGFNLNVCYPEQGDRVRCAIEDFKER